MNTYPEIRQTFKLSKRISRSSRQLVFNTRALLKATPEAKVKWTQDTDEVSIQLDVAKHVSKKAVEFTVHPKRLELTVDGHDYLSGSLEDVGELDVDGCYWFMDDAQETEEKKCLTVVLLKKLMGYQSFSKLLEDDAFDSTITDRVCLMIKIDGKDAGPLLLGLFGRAAPKAVKNFITLVSGRGGPFDERKDLKNGVFDLIFPSKYAQFGFEQSANEPPPFEPENLMNETNGLKHDAPMLLSFDPKTSVWDFVVTFDPRPEFDDERIVFGKVTHGLDLLSRIEAQGDEKNGKPLAKVAIVQCEEIQDADINLIIQEEKKRRILESD